MCVLPVPLRAGAGVSIHLVHTHRSILTVLILTLIIVHTAVTPHEAWGTHTPGHTHVEHEHVYQCVCASVCASVCSHLGPVVVLLQVECC